MLQAIILSNQFIAPGFKKLAMECPDIASQARPGQFVMVKVASGYDPLLRRPFGIHRRLNSGRIEILYQIVGRGTALLADMQPGLALDVLGPLGNGFSICCYPINRVTTIADDIRQAVIVGGGIGIAPLMFLAEELAAKKTAVEVFYGASTANHLVGIDRLESLGIKPHISTDDGSAGFKGFISQLLENYLAHSAVPQAYIYACGPRGMLAAVADIASQYNLPCEVSLDAVMACGMGACLGCVVKGSYPINRVTTGDRGQGEGGKYNYLRVCQEGPVFAAGDIQW